MAISFSLFFVSLRIFHSLWAVNVAVNGCNFGLCLTIIYFSNEDVYVPTLTLTRDLRFFRVISERLVILTSKSELTLAKEQSLPISTSYVWRRYEPSATRPPDDGATGQFLVFCIKHDIFYQVLCVNNNKGADLVCITKSCDWLIIYRSNPVRTRVRIGPPYLHACHKRRLNRAVLRMRQEKLRSRVTVGVAW
jgi:hypothetical protein